MLASKQVRKKIGKMTRRLYLYVLLACLAFQVHVLTLINQSETVKLDQLLLRTSSVKSSGVDLSPNISHSNLDVCSRVRESNTSVSFYSLDGRCKSPDWRMTQLTRQDGNLTLSTLVPALKNDGYEVVLKLLESIEKATVPPDEVVIAMSNVGKDENNTFCNGFLKELTQVYTKSPIKLICIGERRTAGIARNVAAKSSRGELLSMADSDDTEYPIRNEVTKNVFECHDRRLKLFLHGFSKRTQNTDSLLAIPDGCECAEDEKGVKTVAGARLYDKLEKTHKIMALMEPGVTHGYPVVHRTVFEEAKYSSLYKGEDCLFLRDVLYSLGRNDEAAVFLNRPLIFYLKEGRAYTDLH